MSNVDFETEWDIDGDRRYERTPAFFFIDSGGGLFAPVDYSTISYRARAGKVGAGLGGLLFADEWELRVEMKDLWLVDVPVLKRAGLMCGVLKPEFMLGGQWWGFPIIQKRTAGCV